MEVKESGEEVVGRHLRITRWNKNSNSPQGLTSKLTNAVTVSCVVRRATQVKLGAQSTESRQSAKSVRATLVIKPGTCSIQRHHVKS